MSAFVSLSSKQVDPDFRTSNPRVFAVGDVTGPPGLASSAIMGGRSVSSYLFKGKMQQLRQYMLETSKQLEVRVLVSEAAVESVEFTGFIFYFFPMDSARQCLAGAFAYTSVGWR